MKLNNSFHLRKQEPLLANDGQFEFIQSLDNKALVAYRMYNEQQSILFLLIQLIKSKRLLYHVKISV